MFKKLQRQICVPFKEVWHVFRNCLNASGRASRLEFWSFAVFVVSPGCIGSMLFAWFASVFLLVMFFPTTSVFVRRLHDINLPASLFGFLAALWIVFAFLATVVFSVVLPNPAYVGVVTALLSVPVAVGLGLCSRRGNENPNAFGAGLIAQTS
jgi:uncharacterized membrane protein YhaH (DUF805 family)